VGGTDYRFRIHHYDGESYRAVEQQEVDTKLPILFKPMGGFAIPDFLELYRRNRQYLFLGLRLLRDTERMVPSDMIYASYFPSGYALIADPTEKERRFCQNKGIDVADASMQDPPVDSAYKHHNRHPGRSRASGSTPCGGIAKCHA
jgi:hypothetical protein